LQGTLPSGDWVFVTLYPDARPEGSNSDLEVLIGREGRIFKSVLSIQNKSDLEENIKQLSGR